MGAITTIGYDHQQYLGDTIEEIAFEKAGIIKSGMTAVLGALPPAALAVIRRVATERGARVIDAEAETSVSSDLAEGTARISLRTSKDAYGPVTLGLRGQHQIGNALVAVRMLEETDANGVTLSRTAIEQGLSEPNWPARLELFSLAGGRRLLMDAAHNIDGANALADHLRRWHPERPALVIGVMHDKDVDAMLRALLPAVSSVIATAARTTRALPPEELARRADAAGRDIAAATGTPPVSVTVIADPDEAVEAALHRSSTVCVAGSIFLAGAVREGLRRRALLR